MAIYTMFPIIEERELARAVNLQFDVDIDNMPTLLFGDDYSNDSYKSFYFDEMEEYHGYSWENETEIWLRNLVRAYLKDILPNYNKVLIDVSW